MSIETILSKTKNLCHKVRDDVPRTTGILLIGTPLYTAGDLFIAGLTMSETLVRNCGTVAVSYVGITPFYLAFREKWHEVFHVDKNSELQIGAHDSYCGATFSAMYGAITCAMVSQGDLEKTIAGTAISAILGFSSGALSGFGADAFAESIGKAEPNRLRHYLGKHVERRKKLFAPMLAGVSLALISSVYALKYKYPDVSLKDAVVEYLSPASMSSTNPSNSL